MSTIGSLEAFRKGLTTGFIGYPRDYVEGDSLENSFIHGVDQAGETFTLQVMPPERFLEAAKKEADMSIPSVEKLAETHNRARNPCIAMPDNGPLTMTGGVFLAEQVQVVDAEKKLYRANWLSVLKDWETALNPMFGIGYLESNIALPFTAQMESLKQKLITMNRLLDSAQAQMASGAVIEKIGEQDLLDYSTERDQLVLELYRTAKKWFIAVDVQYRRAEIADTSNEAIIRRQILEIIDSNSVNGMYGGVILRPYREENGKKIVDGGSVKRLNHAYDYGNNCVPVVSSVWDDFIKRGGSGWMKVMKRDGFKVDIIPIQRVNGLKSNEKYSKEFLKGVLPKQIKAFVDKCFHNAPYVSFANQNAYLATPYALRAADTRKKEFKGTVLLSSLHAFGKPIGNVLEIDKDLQRSYRLAEQPKPIPPRPRAAQSFDK